MRHDSAILPIAPPPRNLHIKTTTLRTLKEVEQREYRLVAHCPNCGDFQTLCLKELIAELGPDFDFMSHPGLLQNVVSCIRCGRPGIPVTVMEYSPESGSIPRGT